MLAVPQRPLEVIHEGPVEITGDGDACLDGFVNLRQVGAQVTDAALVAHPAVKIDAIRNRDAVLGHHHLALGSVILPDTIQDLK